VGGDLLLPVIVPAQACRGVTFYFTISNTTRFTSGFDNSGYRKIVTVGNIVSFDP
jgi:hypothetical protein